MPSVSIIIPNYNYGHFADQFFTALCAQTMPLSDIEIIFVDDGSDDDSIERAQKWSQRIQCHRFAIETPPRIGKPGPVRNHGLSMAKGNYLLTLDPDDIIHPDFIKNGTDLLNSDATIDLVYTDYREIHPNSIHEIQLPKYTPAQLRTQNPLPPTALYRRKLWDAGIRYRDNTAYEDWDYWIQCAMKKAQFTHLPQTLYDYRRHDSSYSKYAIPQDGPAKAQIVLNNPDFFHHFVIGWAQDFFRGRLHAQPFRRGYIPGPNDVQALLKLIEKKNLE